MAHPSRPTEFDSLRAELLQVTGIKPTAGETEKDFLIRLQKTLSEGITDDQWDSLSPEAQSWSNDTADEVSSKREPVPLPAAVVAAPAPAAGGRRGRAAAAAPAPAVPVEYVPALGDTVVITTKRGKVSEGIIVDLDDGGIVINAEGEAGDKNSDEEFTVANVTIVKATGQQSLDTEQVDEPSATLTVDPAGPAEPEVGDTVQVVTARDKTIMGKVVLIEDDDLILADVTGVEHELSISRLKSVKVQVKAAPAKPVEPPPAAAPAPAAAGRRGRAAAAPAAATPAAESEEPRGKRSVNPGISVGNRIREIVANDAALTVEQVMTKLKGEGIQFRDATAELIYKDTHTVLGYLKTAKKLK